MVHPVYNAEAAETVNAYQDIYPLSIPLCGREDSSDYASDKTSDVNMEAYVPQDHTDISMLPYQCALTADATCAMYLHGYYLDRPETDDLIIYFGGISDDAAGGMLKFHDDDAFQGSFIEDYDIAIIDWPGYGTSDGKASDESLRLAAVTVVNYFKYNFKLDNFLSNEPSETILTNEVPSNPQIVIMAYSMGCGPAAYAASECGCNGLILIAPYASSDDLYNSVINIFHGSFKALLSYHMDTAVYASHVTAPALVIASKSDKRVPYESSAKVFDALNTSVSEPVLVSFEGLSHAELTKAPSVLSAINSFLNDLQNNSAVA